MIIPVLNNAWSEGEQQRLVAASAPTLWLSSKLSSITAADNAVSAWASRTGAISFVQATAANKPKLTRADNLENLFNPSPATSTVGYVQANVTVDAVSASDWDNRFTTAVTFGDNSVVRYFYVERILGAYPYVVSVYVRMDDGSLPDTSGGGIDFRFSAAGTYRDGMVIENLGGGLYRVSSDPFNGNGINAQYGVVKLNTYSAKTFKVQGFQIRSALADPTYLPTTTAPQYRGVNGRPAVFFDGVDDVMTSTATIGSIFAADAKTGIITTASYKPNTAVGLYQWQSGGRFHIELNGISPSSPNRFTVKNYDSGGAFDSCQTLSTTPEVTGKCGVLAYTHDGTTVFARYQNDAGNSVASGNTASLTPTLVIGNSSSPSTSPGAHIVNYITWNKVLHSSLIDRLTRLFARERGASLK